MDPEVTLLLTLEFPLSWHLDSLPPLNTFWNVLNPYPVVALGWSQNSLISHWESLGLQPRTETYNPALDSLISSSDQSLSALSPSPTSP